MKRIMIIAAVLAIAAGCTGVDVQEINNEGISAPQITATIGDNLTKTVLETDDEGVGTIYWKPSDEIKVFYGNTGVKYTSQNTSNATTAVFETTAIIGSTESATTNRWGLYPYDAEATCDGSAVTTTIPATQYGVEGSFDDDLYVTLAHSQSNMFNFYNVCGGIKFSLSRSDIKKITFKGNNDEILAGKIALAMVDDLPGVSSIVAGEKTITLTPKTGDSFAADTYYYIVCLPVEMTGGFTMTFETATQLGTFEYTDKSVTTRRSVFSKKDEIDKYAEFGAKPEPPVDLSSSGTANCYIVPSAGRYTFKASVKGNSLEALDGTPKTAEVLWETFGTLVKPEAGDIISSVSLEDGYVVFTSTGTEGSALVAVKDAGGNVLWSWHLWCTSDDLDNLVVELRNNAGTIMDRNLGATTGDRDVWSCFSLLYQYGRKDPFLGCYPEQVVNYTPELLQAESTGEWNTEASSGYDYAISHPTTFLSDWAKDNDADICWTNQKNKYDPCPPGYRVPDKYVYAAAAEYYSGESSMWDVSNNGTVICWYNGDNYTDYRSVWFPNTNTLFSHNDLRAYRMYGTGRQNGTVWACGSAFYSEMYDGYVNMAYTYFPKYTGNGVRCVTESSPIVVMPDSLKISADSVRIAPGGSFELEATVYPANANVKRISWNYDSFNIEKDSDNSVRFTDRWGNIAKYSVGAYSPLAVYGANDEYRISWDGNLAEKCTVYVCPDEPNHTGGWYIYAEAGHSISFHLHVGTDDDGPNYYRIYLDNILCNENSQSNSSCYDYDFSYNFTETFKGWLAIDVGWGFDVTNITTTASVWGRANRWGSDIDLRMDDSWQDGTPNYKFKYENGKLTMN